MSHRLTLLLLVTLSTSPAWALGRDEKPPTSRRGGVKIEINVERVGEEDDAEPPPTRRRRPSRGEERRSTRDDAATPPTGPAAPASGEAQEAASTVPAAPVDPAAPASSAAVPAPAATPPTTDAAALTPPRAPPAPPEQERSTRAGELRFTGLVYLSSRDVERVGDVRPGDEPERVLRRLERSGLFAAGEPRVSPSGEVEIALTEHRWVRSVRVRGLTESTPEEVVEALFPGLGDPDDDAFVDAGSSLVARTERGRFVPGIAQGGVEEHLRRALQRLHDNGYRLASLSAELDRYGNLDVELDEGRIGRVTVEGVSEELAERIRALSGLREGELFLASDVDQALDRVADQHPSLKVVRGRGRKRARLYVDATRGRDGATEYRGGFAGQQGGDGYELRGRALALKFSGTATPRAQVRGDAGELFRHTPVTGFAPGIALNVTVYEKEDRARLVLDGGFNVNTAPEVARRVDGFAGARVQLPSLQLAELGGQVYRLTDTQDRWRTSAIDSYLSSMFLNAPESEYFQRDGFTLLGGVNVTERLRLGAEYRRDLYRSLESLPKVFVLFRGARYGASNPEIDEGRMASGVVRLEYSSEPPETRRPRTMIDRLSEQWMDWRARDRDRNSLSSVNTVEIGSRALGTSDFEFYKLVSDSRAFLTTGRNQGVRLRFRAAGGRNLPRQKEESLGGWSALRGYGFKEFRGELSLLGTLEYDYHLISLFADLGTVKQGARWVEPRLSLGTALNLGDSFRIAAAWRTDELARALPAFHAVFQQPF